MDREIRSPGGDYIVTVSSWEARMSLWVDTPTLTDARTGETLLAFEDPNWSLDTARWMDDSTVVLTLRKYPGNHKPASVELTVDCAARTAIAGSAAVKKLGEVERQLESALEWV